MLLNIKKHEKLYLHSFSLKQTMPNRILTKFCLLSRFTEIGLMHLSSALEKKLSENFSQIF